MSRTAGNCWNCGSELGPLDYGRADICKKCGRDTKTCKGCVFYDPSANNQCREPQAERVIEKERSNFCDYFRPAGGPGQNPSTSRDSLKSAADALFRKK